MAVENEGQAPRIGRPRKLQEEHIAQLRKLTKAQPASTLEELADLLFHATGLRVSDVTLASALKDAGIFRVKPKRAAGYAQPPSAGAKRYGYKPEHRDAGDEDRYATNMTDAEWALVSDLFESTAGGVGKPSTHSRRVMLDACNYVVRTGCAWRLLPKTFPRWEVVYKTFRRWTAQGRFERMHERLRGEWRRRAGKPQAPSVAVLDSQSTRGSAQGGVSGFDAAKRVKGRKRNVVVDSMGLVLAVCVTAASVQDRDGALPVMAQACAKYPSIATLVVDSAYAGQCARQMRDEFGLKVNVARHPANRNVGHWHDSQLPLFTQPTATLAFSVMPMRWVVERTHAWIERARRLVVHHDRRTDVSASWVWLSEARRLLRGLTASGRS